MGKITYKGIDYPVRTFRVLLSGNEQDITLADMNLFNALYAENKGEKFTDLKGESEIVDNRIYFYVDAGNLELSPDEICKKHLDINMKFIEEFL